jgi:hypothetical protein
VLAYTAIAVHAESCGGCVVRLGAGLGWRAVESRGAVGFNRALGCAVAGCVGRAAGVGDGCGHGA